MFLEFHKRNYAENSNLRLFTANGKWQTSVCLPQMETENGSLFSFVSK
jgi:hypothetical protein